MSFNFLPKYVSNFSHYKKHSARWYRKCKAIWCKALSIVIRLQLNTNIQVKVSKNPKRLRDNFFIAEEQTERGMGILSLTVAFRNFGTPLQTRHGPPGSFIDVCRMRRFLAVLRSFFHSSILYILPCHTSTLTTTQSSFTSYCHIFLRVPLSLVVPIFIYNSLLLNYTFFHSLYMSKPT